MPNPYCEYIITAFMQFFHDHDLTLDRETLTSLIYEKLDRTEFNVALPGMALTVKHILDTLTAVNKNPPVIDVKAQLDAAAFADYMLAVSQGYLQVAIPTFSVQPADLTMHTLEQYRMKVEAIDVGTQQSLENIMHDITTLIQTNKDIIPKAIYDTFMNRIDEFDDDIVDFEPMILNGIGEDLRASLIRADNAEFLKTNKQKLLAYITQWNKEVVSIGTDASLRQQKIGKLNQVIDLMRSLGVSHVKDLPAKRTEIIACCMQQKALVPDKITAQSLLSELHDGRADVELFIAAVLTLARHKVFDQRDKKEDAAMHFDVTPGELTRMERIILKSIGFNLKVPVSNDYLGLLRVHVAQMDSAERAAFIAMYQTPGSDDSMQKACIFAAAINSTLTEKLPKMKETLAALSSDDLRARMDKFKIEIHAVSITDNDAALIDCALKIEMFQASAAILKQRPATSTTAPKPTM